MIPTRWQVGSSFQINILLPLPVVVQHFGTVVQLEMPRKGNDKNLAMKPERTEMNDTTQYTNDQHG
jgi:hypothetical protein